ncbi:MAG: hypothetical protein Q7T55_07920 [Solirubrobacteraceae bacterium]|nr:hypothetical protein [Solirubrobacteraceae bacterium]
MTSIRTVFLAGPLMLCMAFAAPATAQDGDYGEAPLGYDDCGFRDYENGGWTDDPPAGVFLRAYARDMTCQSARRAVSRVKFSRSGKPSRAGYRCQFLANQHEYYDIRCRKIGGKATFRYQTGA